MGRHASRRAANSANRRIMRDRRSLWLGSTLSGLTSGGANPAPDAASTAVAQQLHRHLSATMPGLLSCEACGRQVFTLVEGRCATCGRPAEGKNLREMTEAQQRDTHDCGVRNSQHVDGWDGNWLDCAEAKRRLGR